MPIHLEEKNFTAELKGVKSSLIIACNMCAGASIAMRENKPFLEIFKKFLVSPPLYKKIKELQETLRKKGIETEWFKGGIIQQFFLCLWTKKQCRKLNRFARNYDAAIVLGCDSAFKTARDSLMGTSCKVIEGTEVGGVMNTKTRLHFPFNISFEDSRTTSICKRKRNCPFALCEQTN
jgi:hypothetical protein